MIRIGVKGDLSWMLLATQSATVHPMGQQLDNLELTKGIEKARLKYKPAQVKILLIAEAPPDSIERFFYYENVRERDYLFLGVTQVLYPRLKDEFIFSGRSSEKKSALLNKLKADGLYLMDLSDLPKSLLDVPVESCVSDLLMKVKVVANENTKIILIKANVYESAYEQLRKVGYNVINQRIPFPSSGQQTVFQNKFREALKAAKYSLS